MTFTDLASAPPGSLAPITERLRLAVTAYLARFRGSSREHTESGLRCYLPWCADQGLDPLAAQRPHLELYIRWMQEIRRFKPSAISGGSPPPPGSTAPAPSTAPWNTRPPSTSAALRCPPNHPPWASPTCSSRPRSPQPGGRRTGATSRWWPCPGCSACGPSRPPAPTSARSTATGCCACAARAPRWSWSPPAAVGRAIARATGLRERGPILLNSRGARMDRHAATRRLRQLAQAAGLRVSRAHPHMLRHILSA